MRLAIFLIIFCNASYSSAATTPKSRLAPKPSNQTSSKGSASATPLGDLSNKRAPIPFRCDRMKMNGQRYLVICDSNVVIQHDTLLLCCDSFNAQADEKWNWQRLLCRGNVRAYMDGRWMWGLQADYDVTSQLLVITGRPLLRQAESSFAGSAITVQVDQQLVDVKHPRGVLVRDENPSAVPAYKVLPLRCPLPDRASYKPGATVPAGEGDALSE